MLFYTIIKERPCNEDRHKLPDTDALIMHSYLAAYAEEKQYKLRI